jgi:transposase-like protein
MQACGHTPIWSGQRVERTNARGRHTYVPAFKRWVVEQAKLPGMSLAALAMSNQVNANQLRRWVQLHDQHRADSIAAATLLPVTVAAQETPASAALGMATAAVEVELAGAVVRVREGVAPATLRLVLACLRGAAP